MLLILTEKPSVAKAFAEALGVPRKGSFWENSNYCICNALGHLLENYSPQDYDPTLKKWSLDGLPIIPERMQFKPIEKTKEQLAVVKNCFVNHKIQGNFLLATDAEREGELIGAEILHYVGFKNHSNSKRFWVSEALTPEVIKKGIENAKPLSDYSSYLEQGYARQHADWLIGMNLTRLVTLKSGKLLHVGRVQTALLGAVYEREKIINNFIAQKYCEVKATLSGKTTFSVKLVNPENTEFHTRFHDNSPVLSEIAAVKDDLKTGVIHSLLKEKKETNPPQLFNLTALQKEAHKKYSYSPEQTLDIAQALYEKHKCLSYPRTPSRVMGDDNVGLVKNIFDILIAAFSKTEWAKDITGSDPSFISASNKRIFNSKELQDHHALIPLMPYPKECSESEINIYLLVFQRFFDTLKQPYIYNSVSILVDISGYSFIGKGVEVLQTGWKIKPDDEDKDETQNYSGLEKDKEYSVKNIEIENKVTEPKKHYTFASLLQLMENPRGDDGTHLTGLGTPATRGSILQKLVERKYIALKGKNILITDNGKFLIENILKNKALASFISVPETTRWEEQLHQDTEIFLYGIKNLIRNVVNNTEMDIYKKEKVSLGKCPLCGSDVYEGKKNYYCSNYKGDPPCTFSIWMKISAASISTADAQALLAGKKTKVKKCVNKAEKEFQAAFKLEKGKIAFIFTEIA